MNRSEVYRLIDGEREYQQYWDRERKDFNLSERDESLPVEAWILWMEDYLQQARRAATIENRDKTVALETIRKVAALAVACMEFNETPPRK